MSSEVTSTSKTVVFRERENKKRADDDSLPKFPKEVLVLIQSCLGPKDEASRHLAKWYPVLGNLSTRMVAQISSSVSIGTMAKYFSDMKELAAQGHTKTPSGREMPQGTLIDQMEEWAPTHSNLDFESIEHLTEEMYLKLSQLKYEADHLTLRIARTVRKGIGEQLVISTKKMLEIVKNIAPNCPNLKSVSFTGYPQPEHVATFLQGNNSVRSLSYSFFEGIEGLQKFIDTVRTHSSLQHVSGFFSWQYNGLTKLHTVRLIDNFSDQYLKMLDANPQIKKATYYACHGLTREKLELHLKRLKSLEVLEFESCQGDSDFIQAVFVCPSLKFLKVWSCQSTPNWNYSNLPLTMFGCDLSKSALEEIVLYSTLDFSFDLLTPLAQLPRLTTLRMSMSKITKESIEKMAFFFNSCKSLETVELMHCYGRDIPLIEELLSRLDTRIETSYTIL